MSGKSANNPSSNQRVCDRIAMSRVMLLELDNGEILRGQSVDVSPRGALMETDIPPEDGLLGVAGTLFLISKEGEFSIGYPCRVARVGVSTIALEVDKSAAAAFGNYMAKDLLGY